MISKTKVHKLLKDNPSSYYYIGLLLADGHFPLSRKNIDISLSSIDKDYLCKYAKYIEYNKELAYREKTDQYRVSVSDPKYISMIIDKFNISNRKTYEPPSFTWIKDTNPDLYLSLWAGFIDGDGNIRHKPNRKGKLSKSFSIRITSHKAWQYNLKEFEEFLYSYFKIKRHKDKKYPTISKRDDVTLNIGDINLIKSYKSKLKDIGIDKLLMSRKWEIIDSSYKNPQTERSINNKDKIILFLKQGKTVKEISDIIKVTPEYISHVIRKNNLYGLSNRCSKDKRKLWSDEEISILNNKYKNVIGKEICEFLPNRTYDTICSKANKMGLYKEK